MVVYSFENKKQVGDTMAKPKTKKEKTEEELQESQDYKDLIDYIFKRIYDTPHPLVYKQIKEFKEQGKTYFGMLHSLIYFYDTISEMNREINVSEITAATANLVNAISALIMADISVD